MRDKVSVDPTGEQDATIVNDLVGQDDQIRHQVDLRASSVREDM
jgi:hypothetical protein